MAEKQEPWKRNVEVGKPGKKFRVRSQTFKRIKRSQLERDPLNWRVHGEQQVDALRGSLREIGFVGALLVRKKPRARSRFYVIDGHARWEEFAPNDLVPCCVVDINDNDAKKLLAVYDNVTQLADADRAMFEKLIAEVDFDNDELDQMVDAALADMPAEFQETELEKPEPPEHVEESKTEPSEKRAAYRRKCQKQWKVKRGQLFEIPSQHAGVAPHRVGCGDVTHDDEIEALLAGAVVDCMLTDPPYCSGGFQESGRSGGSIGTLDKTDEIHADRISTRGHRQLIKSASKNINPTSALIFSDWRMWQNTTDAIESEGHQIRSLIVWDKQYAGFGSGFRAQHEFVCFSARKKLKHDPAVSGGNVVSIPRTMNRRHQSEKPVDLIVFLLRVHNTAAVICDPFAGSGTTLIAAEQLGRRCFCLDLVPQNVAVILDRAAEAGLNPKLIK